MPFPSRLLTEGEEIVLDLRPHWIMLVGPVSMTVVILAVAVGAAVGLSKTSLPDSASWVWLALAAAAIVVWCATALPVLLRWTTTQFALTNERLIARSGVVAKRSKEIPLEVINDITFTQSLFDRIVGAGALVVESAGERGQETFGNVRKPEDVQKAIYRASEARKGLGSSTTGMSVADEIAKLAALRDNGTISADEFEARKQRLLQS